MWQSFKDKYVVEMPIVINKLVALFLLGSVASVTHVSLGILLRIETTGPMSVHTYVFLRKNSNLVDSASSIRLSQRLSHACLSINKSIL